MRLELATPWNAVVAQNRQIAEALMDAFRLSSEMWEPRAFGESFQLELRAHRPGKLSRFGSPPAQNHFQLWMSRVSPHGTVKVI